MDHELYWQAVPARDRQFERAFKRIVGVTPRQYAAAQRVARFKGELRSGQHVTDALYNAGFQSSSAAYAETADQFGMTPTEYQRGGHLAQIAYTIAPCSLGWLLLAATEKGICAVRPLAEEFPDAALGRAEAGLTLWLGTLLATLDGRPARPDLPLDVRATAFQRRAWEALTTIPYGSTRSYGEVAAAIGQPTAARGRACATNPPAPVIPCHRVIRGNGDLGGYRWGLARKQALLAQETRSVETLEVAGAGGV